jgi:DNA polymerase I-like protein with 3'-5' exonuclease and polymerase domains
MPRITRRRALAALEAWKLDQPWVIAVDTETTGLGWHDTPFAATLTWRASAGHLESHYFELPGLEEDSVVAEILERTQTWVFHNAKFDLQKLILGRYIDRVGLRAESIEDTETLAHLLDENRAKALKTLAVTELGYDDTIEVEIKSGPNKGQMRQVPREKHELDTARRAKKLKKEDGYAPLPRRVVIPYAKRDTDFTLLLYEKLRPQVAAIPSLEELYRREQALALALLDMEARGIGVDVGALEELKTEYTARRFDAELELRELSGNPELNPNAPAQLLTALEAAGLPAESTDKAALRDIEHPLAAGILEFRHTHKILNTYVENLLAEQRDGVFHPWFRANGARTGRTSSSSASE